MKNIKTKDLYKVKKIKCMNLYGDMVEDIGMLIQNAPSDNHWHSKYSFVSVDNKKHLISEKEPVIISIVRNVPKVIREKMTKLGSYYKEQYKLGKELYEVKIKLTKNIDEIQEKVQELSEEIVDDYMDEYGILTEKVFGEKVGKIFRNLTGDIQNTQNYTFGARDIYNEINMYKDNINIAIDVFSKKYAQEGDLGIIYQEYDGSLHIDVSDEQEKELVSKYAQSSLKYTDFEKMKKAAEKTNVNNKLYKVNVCPYVYIGDKNRLNLGINVDFKIKNNILNNEAVDEFEKVLRKILNV